ILVLQREAVAPSCHDAPIAGRGGPRSRGDPMIRKRRSYEAGHKPKFLAVTVVMLRVIETHDHGQQWLGVADIMRAEAREEANAMLARFAARCNGIAGITPECVIREGDVAE